MKAAIAQINSVLGDLNKNIDRHIECCNKAIEDNADIIIFPELSLTGYSVKDINYDIAFNPYKSDKLKKLTELSKKISIVAGFIEEDEKYAVYNSAILLEDGEIKGIHRKIYPPTYGIFEEYRYFSKGMDCTPIESKFGKLGIMVCEDLWHMTVPYTMAMAGAKILIGIACSPTRLAVDTEHFKNYDINSEHHKTYARILSSYLLFCNRVGFEDGVNFWGGSEAVDPSGNIVSVAKIFEEDMIYAELKETEVQRARRNARHFLDEDLDKTLKNLNKLNL
jgi:predicted amidohydrolase